jgi:hypothetical protein
MSTLISSIARGGRLTLAGMAARPTAVLAVPLLAVGVLAAGCASASGAGAAGTAPSSVLASGGTASRGAPGHATAPTAPSASPAPVSTLSGGPGAAGGAACTGWPAGARSGSLPVSFVPTSVERCVNGVETIPGKGLWATATLQRANSGLGGLVDALRRPSATHKPGTFCPAIAIIPPQVVLISASGQKLIPRLPVTGCGLVQSQVLAALNGLHWQTLSVRLISEIPGATAPTVSGTPPRSIQTVSGMQPQ